MLQHESTCKISVVTIVLSIPLKPGRSRLIRSGQMIRNRLLETLFLPTTARHRHSLMYGAFCCVNRARLR